MDSLLLDIVIKVIFALLFVAVIMSLAAYSVLGERKVASWIQGRVGPNRTALPGISAIPVLGPQLVKLGIWQPLADGVKFLFKEDPLPGHVNKLYYCLAPCIALVPALTTMVVLPVGQYMDGDVVKPIILANVDIGILFILAFGSLGVYGIVIGGWAANSKYPYFGGIRSSAQMISYELAMGMSILPVLIWANGPNSGLAGLSLFNIVESQQGMWLGVWMPIPAFIFLVSLYAETNRLPFDMPESETELVGGFHTEYGSFKFGLFFVGEYAHMVIGSAVFTILFLGGWNFLPDFGIESLHWLSDPWALMPNWLGGPLSVIYFIGKTLFFVFLFMWVRWTLPRFRYDQVMTLGWKYLVPGALICVVAYAIIIGLWDIAFAIDQTPAIVE
ncbi:complex I subunit 1/NuoH family protein [Cerasicoccus maritimus]|uniref:complex I subunit 1/NuoH family protein n=1 Tax=Cerasicoccus maritimus TaxID=490089 RepID=UPI002852822C|nr:complex I subunit 1 family protein [Cerasicoccus maritimus]